MPVCVCGLQHVACTAFRLPQLTRELATQVMAGAKVVRNIARWDGEAWQRVEDYECVRQCTSTGADNACQSRNCELDGVVTALAVSGSHIFAAGEFGAAGGKPARRLAHYTAGRWGGVSGGVSGSVYAISLFKLQPRAAAVLPWGVDVPSCLYVAGQFSAVVNATGGEVVAQNIARACWVGSSGSELEWETLRTDARVGPTFALLHTTPQEWSQN